MPRICLASDLGTDRLCEALAPNLRGADLAEMEACGMPGHAGLIRNCEVSGEKATWAIVDDDNEPLALFGAADCTKLGEGVGAPWLRASEALITQHRRWLIRNTRRIVTTPDHLFSRFFNFVDARNTVHVRWLKWAGFVVLPAALWGTLRLPFHPFFRKSAHV